MPVTADPAVRRVLALMAATAVTGMGSGLFLLTGPWLMYNLTHSAFWVGALSAVAGLMFWAGPPLAHLVDRYDRRHVQVLALVALRCMVSMGATPTASVLAGWAAGQLGAPPVLVGFGVLTVLGAGWAAWQGQLSRVTLTGDIAPRLPSPSATGVGEG